MRNKNNIRKTADNHQKWLEKKEGYDPISLEQMGDGVTPFSKRCIPSILEDIYEKLEELYYGGHLKGRQKQIVTLLLDGFTSQTDLVKALSMKQSNVSVELRKIMKKISKNII